MKPFSQRAEGMRADAQPRTRTRASASEGEGTEASHRAPASVGVRVSTEVSQGRTRATNPAAVFPEPQVTLTRKARSTMRGRIRNHHGTRQSRQEELVSFAFPFSDFRHF